MTQPHQLVFSFPDVVAYGEDNFIALPGNEMCLKAVQSAATWAHYGLIVTGASHTGKTHLAWIFQQKMGAAFIGHTHLQDLVEGRDWVEEGRAYILDGGDDGIINQPEGVFHLLNLIKEKRAKILITLRRTVGQLSPLLPDTHSRLKALPQMELTLSDDGLRILLIKRLADQQIQVDARLIDFMLTRFSRNVDDMVELLHRLNQESLRQKKPISRAMLREFMETGPT